MTFYQAQLAKFCFPAECKPEFTFMSFLGAEIEHNFVLTVVKVIVSVCVQLPLNIQYGPVVLQRSLTCWWSLKTECLLIPRQCQIVSSASIAFSRRILNRYSLLSPVPSPTCTFSHAALEYLAYAVTVDVILSWCHYVVLSIAFRSRCKFWTYRIVGRNVSMLMHKYKCLITMTNFIYFTC